MTALALAWKTAARYRARAVLAVAGVATIGALNFDMLLLSRGLLRSFEDLINSTGYDVRIVGNSGLPLARFPIDDAERHGRQRRHTTRNPRTYPQRGSRVQAEGGRQPPRHDDRALGRRRIVLQPGATNDRPCRGTAR